MNAQGDQDLIVYLLSPDGQIELTNYRTARIHSNNEVPEFVKEEFKEFYTAMFQTVYEEENKEVAFLEYAWDMSTCDPCSAEPLSQSELKEAGVFWLDKPNQNNRWASNNVFITRLHVRYNRENFPEDLKFQSTSDRSNFQGRYVIRHPYTGDLTCEAGKEYQQQVRKRQEQEVKTLASITGWKIEDIRDRIKFVEAKPIQWWDSLWSR